jgi:hypothetical protein
MDVWQIDPLKHVSTRFFYQAGTGTLLKCDRYETARIVRRTRPSDESIVDLHFSVVSA